jgi:DNA-directed RNA polymerase subunit K/omega
MNKFEAVVIASQEARRINELAGKDEKESLVKPAVVALKRLADEKLKIKVENEQKG